MLNSTVFSVSDCHMSTRFYLQTSHLQFENVLEEFSDIASAGSLFFKIRTPIRVGSTISNAKRAEMHKPWPASLSFFFFEDSFEVTKFSSFSSFLIPLVPPSLHSGDLQNSFHTCLATWLSLCTWRTASNAGCRAWYSLRSVVPTAC